MPVYPESKKWWERPQPYPESAGYMGNGSDLMYDSKTGKYYPFASPDTGEPFFALDIIRKMAHDSVHNSVPPARPLPNPDMYEKPGMAEENKYRKISQAGPEAMLGDPQLMNALLRQYRGG